MSYITIDGNDNWKVITVPGVAGTQHVVGYQKMDRVDRTERCDASLKPPVRMDNGFLKLEGYLARTGLQEYTDSEGKVHKELRLKEEVFDTESMESCRQAPVTNQHPPAMLTAKNTKKYAVGVVGDNVRQDGEHVAASLTIYDEDAIAAISDGRKQLSNGYSCRLDATTPELIAQYGAHEWVQRDIRINHVALVDAARCGPSCSLRADCAECNSAVFDRIEKPLSNDFKETRIMGHKMKLDGFEIEVADANMQSIIERVIADRIDAVSEKLNDAVKTIADKQAACDAIKAKMDEDSKLLPKLVADGVRNRINIEYHARRILGLAKFDDMSDRDVMVKTCAKISDHKLDAASDSTIKEVFSALVSSVKEISAIDQARTATAPREDRQESPRDRMVARERAAHIFTKKN